MANKKLHWSSDWIPYVGLGKEPDVGGMALAAAPSGLREREGVPWAPPPGLKELDWVRWSCLLLRCMGRTGLPVMLSFLEDLLLHHTCKPHSPSAEDAC